MVDPVGDDEDRTMDGPGGTDGGLWPADPVPGPDGWRRVAFGLLVGLAAGVVAGLLLPRREGPRRTGLASPGIWTER